MKSRLNPKLNRSNVRFFLRYLSGAILIIFVISRSLGFFPVSPWILPFSIAILMSLSYLSNLILQFDRFYLSGLANLLFAIFKYSVFILLTHFFDTEPFNDYSVFGLSLILFSILEIINALIWISIISRPRRSRIDTIVLILTSLVSFLAFVAIALSGWFAEPRRVELRYSGYEPSLEQSVQVWYFDYGGAHGFRGGIHCQSFAILKYGIFEKKIPIRIAHNGNLTEEYRTACHGVF